MLEGVLTEVALNQANERERAERQALAALQSAPSESERQAGLAASAAGLEQQQLMMQQTAAQMAAAAQAMTQGGAGVHHGNVYYGGTWEPPCDHCGVPHKGQCHALALSQGKPVPNWDSKPEEQKQRIQARADDITRLGPWSMRANHPDPHQPATATNGRGGKGGGRGGKGGGRGGCGGGRGATATPAAMAAMTNMMAMMAMMQGAQLPHGAGAEVIHTPPALAAARPSLAAKGGISNLVVDSGNLTGVHLISDKSLFSTFSANILSIPVMVADSTISWTSGGGTCDLTCIGPDGRVTGRLVLERCHYIENFGVNLISVKGAWDDGIRVDFADINSITYNGTVIPFDSQNYTLRVIRTPDGAYPAVITRGKRGKTHIGADNLTDTEKLEMKLWSARFNDPPAPALRQMHHHVQGAPQILRKADIHNTFSDARLLANAPQHSTQKRSQPIATKSGQITSFDHWLAPCVGIFGFTGIIAGVDNHSGHVRLFLVESKAACPVVARRYYLMAQHDGVDIKPGSVLYADNEPIFKSFKLASVADDFDLVQRWSAQYEPWGNGGIESIFRWIPWEIRKMLERGSAPVVLWPLAALHAEFLKNATHARGGVSIKKLWCGHDQDVSNLKTIFCRMTARKPIPWREGKLDIQKLDGVYCGESRTRAGSICLTAEHGLVISTNCDYVEDEFPFATGYTYVMPDKHGGSWREYSGLGRGGGGGGGAGGGGGGAPIECITLKC